jgi:predicted transposase YdaD
MKQQAQEPLRGTVDRFEEEFAVIEIVQTDGSLESIEFLSVPREEVDNDVKEGSFVYRDDSGWHVETDSKEAQERKKEIESLMDDLFVE